MLQRRAHRGNLAGGVRPRRINRFLEPALLLLLHHQASHGYGLIEGMDRLGMEAYPADVSAVYRVLYDLEGAGMVESTRETEQTAGPPRRVYELTERGKTYLADWVQELEETNRLLQCFLSAYYEHIDKDAGHERRQAHAASPREETRRK